ncbi:unnamed protein product [Oppiella nova]|uniref:DNA polymerase epsilon subunit 3 n=1 Tax=Oppiella nova TaxID=334625 RepID=A0A7R9LKP8_9ACAR|nr:unnamed protein product [Oppiella nova]CAG2164192.1 unnamed protein product [Oppiella nova]
MAEKPEDFNMPSNVVSKIIKDALPHGVNVSADVRSAASRSASIFILYVTTCANDIAVANKRKTLSAQDVLEAITQIGFEEFTEELMELHKTLMKEKTLKERQRLKNKSMESKSSQVLDDKDDDNEEEEEDEDEEEDEEEEEED